MTKREFLMRLQAQLSDLSPEEIDGRMNFYSEMIDDYMEEGLSEEEAVAAIGRTEREVLPVDAAPKKHIGGPTVTLLLLGSPVWLALLISAFAVVLSLYTALWSAVISVWAAALSVAISAVGGVLGGLVLACFAGTPGIVLLGAGLACAGLTVFLYYGSLAATRGMLFLTRAAARLVCNGFRRRSAR